ncbi:hypothetical protein Aph02nite_65450 [Actinoplanes philippinensis]|uniref:Uncharacterized protein n=1 Tax=Actinoplanes philippinensis TaxID=35752 RepID=A0A1I2LDP6_9ACTN|nr:hypothetical protein [Actinoplanes philippinensis]GIE80595.1 hypothetical protein Aph02nite_65450 [Actinoplanes philippinensis]SFF76668.1 hypothetical protein SAMN05421541_12129 [Actinoplanes philippinensis]
MPDRAGHHTVLGLVLLGTGIGAGSRSAACTVLGLVLFGTGIGAGVRSAAL